MNKLSRAAQDHAAAMNALAEIAKSSEYQEPARQDKVRPAPMPSFPERQEQGSLHLIKNGLNGGEISPELGSRFDQQRYSMGCHKLLNMIPMPWGGIRKRPGLDFVCTAAKSEPGASVRLMPFIFSQDQSRLLELSASAAQANADLRVFDAEGKLLYEKPAFLPLDSAAIMEMSYCQSADVIFIAHPSIEPAKIMRYADDDWRFETISWLPAIEPPLIYVRACGSWPNGESRRVKYEYVATAIDAETGQESPVSEVAIIPSTAPLSESWYAEIKIQPQQGASEFHIYRKRAGVYGFVGMVDEVSEDAEGKSFYIFEDHNIEPDTADTPPRDRNPFAGMDEKPAIVFLHQQRLGFAASRNKPLTLWLSQSGNYESMAASVPPDDDDAIEASLAASEANSILWAEPDRNGLLLGTQGGVWLLAPSEGIAISPTDLSFQPQCNYGSQEGLRPVRGPSGLIFAQRGGRAVRDLGYSFQDDRYNAADLSVLARHIFEERHISSWAWQQEPWSILWLCLSDGTLAGLTYLREHEIMAWHRHETAGFIEQVCTIPSADGTSAAFFSIIREGQRSIEKFNNQSLSRDTYLADGKNKIPFQARCIPCLPEEKLQEGSTFLMLRKINSIKARIRNSKAFKVQVLSQNHAPSPCRTIPAGAQNTGFTEEAVWSCPIGAGFREDAKLELILDGPDPACILALLINAEFSDMAGGQGK